MTIQECFEQLIGYVADQREALEKGRAIDDTDLYNIDVLLVRLQDQCANNRNHLADKKYEPYFGWCDIDGCDNEGCSGGNCWRDTGYWTVCSKHSADYRNGLKQPKMKQAAMKREKTRGKDGCLAHINLKNINQQ